MSIPNQGKKFYICLTFPCPRRQLDAQRIYRYFLANGFTYSSDFKEADWLVVVTCAYIQASEDQSAYWVKYFLRNKPPSTKMIVTGCFPGINPGRLKKRGLFETIPPASLHKLDDIIRADVKWAAVGDSYESPEFPLYPTPIESSAWKSFISEFELTKDFVLRCGAGMKDRLARLFNAKEEPKEIIYSYPDASYNPREVYTIRLGLGCAGQCSYCAIKFAAGKIKSKPKDEILSEFKAGLEKGYKKFILISGDVGAYGIDIQSSIIEILEAMLMIEGDYKLILKEFNAQWLIKYFDDLQSLLLRFQHKIDFIIIPIQSGSNDVLKRMCRFYKIEDVRDCLRRLKASVPKLSIATHIMVGFPQETEEDFAKSKQLAQEFRFSFVDIYSYEDRPRTEASKLKGKIPERIICQRKEELTKICEAIYQDLPEKSTANI